MAYNVSEKYKDVIYSGDAKHKLKLVFNGVELEDADVYCESFNVTSRIVPNGATRFSLDNFVSKEAELVLHDVDNSIIQSPINISIGTLVEGTYEYVPIGVFIIQDLPTTDKNKTTIKLRDYSVKFDFAYNAKEIIDTNEGSATKFEIFKDICTKAGVETNVEDFYGSSDKIGIYDNLITARVYISYLAEQAGAMATIDREGKLQFVYLNELDVYELPFHLLEKYEFGDEYNISRVLFEDAIRKLESGSDDRDTLFLNSANPYIDNEGQINNILNINQNISIFSLKTGKIIGNPTIDSYDIIKIVDGDKTYQTIATNELKYNGVIIQTFDTQIGKEAKKENVTIIDEPTFRKWASTTINNLEAEVKITTGKVEENSEQITTTTQKVNEFEINIKEIQTSVDTAIGEVNTMAGKITDMSYSFTTKGLSIGTSQDKNNSLLDNTGIKVYNYNTLNAIFNNKGSGIDKLIVTGTAQLGYLRFIKSTKNGKPVTKIFHLNRVIEDLHDLEV